MFKACIFGGTAEGRIICEVCAEQAIAVLYCVATGEGAYAVESLPQVQVQAGRLECAEITALLQQYRPALVIDATHPYAQQASHNIGQACRDTGVSLLRVRRESYREEGCISFYHPDALLAWLAQQPGQIFATTGSSSAELFSRLPDYRQRVWLRILPSLESLNTCLNLGYRPARIICMQGPFSEELNRAMFKHAQAGILVTKNSGALGGFPEKIRAAHSLGMLTAVLSQQNEAAGYSVAEVCERIKELKI